MRMETGRVAVLVISLFIVMAVVGIWTARVGVLADTSLADFDLSWWTVDSGGDLSTDGTGYELSGTIGQPDAGLSSSVAPDYVLVGGFHGRRAYAGCSVYLPLVMRD